MGKIGMQSAGWDLHDNIIIGANKILLPDSK